nr:hypothetical protein [Tanacetum cinerariifolium]
MFGSYDPTSLLASLTALVSCSTKHLVPLELGCYNIFVEILEQQDLSLIGETQFVVVVKLEGNDKHLEELMVLDD